MHTVGTGTNAVLLLLVGAGLLEGISQVATVGVLTLAVGVAGLTVGGGFNVNHLDILPTAAGLLLGVVNMFGSVAGALAPYVMARMTEYPNAEGESGAGDGGLSREQWGDTEPSEAWLAEVEVGWSHVFMLAVAVDCAGMLLYGALLSGERQPWAPRSARAQPRGGGDDE